MKRALVIALLAVSLFSVAVEVEAARRTVVRTRTPRGTRTRVVVRPGFPIRRTLPNVVIRTHGVVRVAPRLYLGPVLFTAAVLSTLPPPDRRVWTASEELEREDGWTDFTVDTDRRGDRMVLEVDSGKAQVSFVEIVFENGEVQVVDFNDRVLSPGIYSLIDFKDGRKVDHVRAVAQATTGRSELRLHLVS